MKNCLRFALLPLTLAGLSMPSFGAISVFAEYRLGETGTLGAENRPQDSSGNGRHFISPISGAAAVVETASPPPGAGSTAYLSTAGAGNEGWYSSNLFSTLPTDNFAFGIYARATDLTGAGDVFALGGNDGALKLSLTASGWAASSSNVSWIGGDGGVAGSFTADAWTHLAVIRSGGISTFYINGAAQGAAFAGAPVHDTAHLSVASGGATYFDGGMDEGRVLTFDAGTPAPEILNALQTVPEPSAGLLALLSLFAGLRRRR